jgi:hypothetical protein
VQEAWEERWLKERDGQAVTRPQETLFKDKTLKRHEGLSKAKSSLLV